MRKGATSEKTKADLEDTKTVQNEALNGTVSGSLNEELNGSIDDTINEESGTFGVTIDDPTALPKDPKKGPKGDKRKDTFVGSFNITTAANDVLKLLQSRTGKSKKDIISNAILNALTVNINAPIIKFNLPSPKELMLFRTEVLILGAESKRLQNVLTSFRPGTKEQALIAAEALTGVHNHLHLLEAISRKLGKKERLLENLSAKEYEELGKIYPYLDEQRRLQKDRPNAKQRLARYDLLEKFLTLIIATDDIVQAPKVTRPGGAI